MSFHKSIRNLIDKYGSDVTISDKDKTVKSKAFIQPLRYKSTMYNDVRIKLGGFSDSRYYLYIGQAGNDFSRSDNVIIESIGKQYVVHSSESFSLMDEELYVWAVLIPYKAERQDEYETD